MSKPFLDPEGIPNELKAIPSWIVWRYEGAGGKPTKVPYIAALKDGGLLYNASSMKPQHWKSFKRALAVYEATDADGIGFVFSDKDPYAVADFDDALQARVDPQIASWLEKLDSYTEVSVSGCGFHVVCEAEITTGASVEGYEVYDRGRYIALTGDVWDERATIEARQETFTDLAEKVRERQRRLEGREIVQRRKKAFTGSEESKIDLLDFIDEHDIQVFKEVGDLGGRKFQIRCPWADQHSHGDLSGSFIGQFDDGALWFSCKHNHCSWRRWEHFRDEVSGGESFSEWANKQGQQITVGTHRHDSGTGGTGSRADGQPEVEVESKNTAETDTVSAARHGLSGGMGETIKGGTIGGDKGRGVSGTGTIDRKGDRDVTETISYAEHTAREENSDGSEGSARHGSADADRAGASQSESEPLPGAISLGTEEVPPPREFFVEGIVPEDCATMLYGDGGTSKSLLALSLGISIAGDHGDWMGFKTKTSNVLYLDFELTADEQLRRAERIAKGSGLERAPEGLFYISALGLDLNTAFMAAFDWCRKNDCKFLIVDSLGVAISGDAEASSDVIGFYREYVFTMLAAGISMFVIDHQAKAQGRSYQTMTSFGSVYKRNLVRSEIQVEAIEQDEEVGELELIFRHKKHNFGPKLKPFGATMNFSDERIRLEQSEVSADSLAREQALSAVDRVLLALSNSEEPMGKTEMSKDLEIPEGTTKNAVTSLKKRAFIMESNIGDRFGGKAVEITSAGREEARRIIRAAKRRGHTEITVGGGPLSYEDPRGEEL